MSYTLSVQSSKTYSKIGRELERRHGVPIVRYAFGVPLIESLMEQIDGIIAEKCRDAAEGAAIAAIKATYDAIAPYLPNEDPDGFFIPPIPIHVNAEQVGTIRAGGYNTVVPRFRVRNAAPETEFAAYDPG